MVTEKEKYLFIAKNWLEAFLREKYSNDYDIEVLLTRSNLSKLAHPLIKKIENYSMFDFKSDILGILINKKNQKVEIVLLNCSINAISIKEIGEINLYCNISNPLFAIIVSPKGLPNEVNKLLLNNNIEASLLSYGKGINIMLLKLNEDGSIDIRTIFPRKLKVIF